MSIDIGKQLSLKQESCDFSRGRFNASAQSAKSHWGFFNNPVSLRIPLIFFMGSPSSVEISFGVLFCRNSLIICVVSASPLASPLASPSATRYAANWFCVNFNSMFFNSSDILIIAPLRRIVNRK